MTPKQNQQYLENRRAEALAEFAKESVGFKWMLSEMIKQRIESEIVGSKLKK